MSDLLAHPLAVLLAGALLTGILVPAITRRWQDRQKELEIKAELVSDLSEAIMQIVMSVQFVRVRAELAQSQPGVIRSDRHQEEVDQAYRAWEVRSAVLGTKLEAYFSQTSIPSEWTSFSAIVTRFYALEGIGSDQQQRAISELRRQLVPLLPTGQQVEESWIGLKEGILSKKGEIIRRVLGSRIVAFRSKLSAH